ncbi:unnamed protein product [Amoebophrya sp. A120]|nr:unnamed protein product [Amoebophrya sp. A120]|eukprot:GSA120T00004804001.1
MAAQHMQNWCIRDLKGETLTAAQKADPALRKQYLSCCRCRQCYQTDVVRAWCEANGNGEKNDFQTLSHHAFTVGDWVCPRCRLQLLDPFFVTEPRPLTAVRQIARRKDQMVVNPLDKSEGPRVRTQFTISTDFHQIRNRGLQMHLRSVRCDHWDFTGAYWANVVQVTVNENTLVKAKSDHYKAKKPDETISKPQYGHIRKEVPHLDLLPFLPPEVFKPKTVRQVTISVTCELAVERQEDGPPPTAFALGVYLVREVPIPELKQKVLITMEGLGKTQDMHHRVSRYYRRLKALSDEVEVVHESVDAETNCVSLTCPLSALPIQLPVYGQYCEHLQSFDFYTFLDLQMKTPMAKRWRCPICNHRCRPFDLRYCQYTKSVLEKATYDPTKDREDGLSCVSGSTAELQAELVSVRAEAGLLTGNKHPTSGCTSSSSSSSNNHKNAASNIVEMVVPGVPDPREAAIRKLLQERAAQAAQGDDSELEDEPELLFEKAIFYENGTFTFDYEAVQREEREKKFGKVCDVEMIDGTPTPRAAQKQEKNAKEEEASASSGSKKVMQGAFVSSRPKSAVESAVGGSRSNKRPSNENQNTKTTTLITLSSDDEDELVILSSKRAPGPQRNMRK